MKCGAMMNFPFMGLNCLVKEGIDKNEKMCWTRNCKEKQKKKKEQEALKQQQAMQKEFERMGVYLGE